MELCIEENQNFLFNIVSHTNEMFENRDHTRIPSVSLDHISYISDGEPMHIYYINL